MLDLTEHAPASTLIGFATSHGIGSLEPFPVGLHTATTDQAR